MIEINLLPPHYKKKINIIAYINVFLPYLFLGTLIFLSLNLILGLFITKRIVSLKSAESAWKKQEPNFKKIFSLKQEIAKLNKEYNNLNKLVSSKVHFSEIMYLLYTHLPINIWFSQLEFKDNTLTIKGSALDFEKDASLSLKEFVDSLNNTKKIAEEFPKISTKSQEIKKIKDKSVLYFDLELKND